MDLLERLKQIMANDFGITTNEQLTEAVENYPEVDFGIFVCNEQSEQEVKCSA